MKRFPQSSFKFALVLAFNIFASGAQASSAVCLSAFEPPTLYKEIWADRVPREAPSNASLFKTFGYLLMGEPGAIAKYKAERREFAAYPLRLQKLEETREQILEKLETENPTRLADVQLLNDTIFKIAVSRSIGEMIRVQQYYESVR
jgi:hypothetical protein